MFRSQSLSKNATIIAYCQSGWYIYWIHRPFVFPAEAPVPSAVASTHFLDSNFSLLRWSLRTAGTSDNTLSPYMSIRVCRIRTSRGLDDQFFFLTKHNGGRGRGLARLLHLSIYQLEKGKEAPLHTCHSLVYSISCLTCRASGNSFNGQRIFY